MQGRRTGLSLQRLKSGCGLALVLIGLIFWNAEAGATEAAVIRRVNDGDTAELRDGRLVRYIGVDAPEIDHVRHTAQPMGFEARMRNAELVAGKPVRLEFDIERLDRHGRTLAYVFQPGGAMVNELLLESGLAFCLFTLPNVKYADRLLAAQHAAMRAKRGIWRNWREAECRYVGNRNSRRFHLAGCPEAKRIAPRNRVVFSKRWDAFWAGYSPSRECQSNAAAP
jgi:micrococcal nuclease